MKKNIHVIIFLLCFCAVVQAQTNADSLLRNINTPNYWEFAPVLSPDGKQLFFSINGHPQNVGDKPSADIWVSHKLQNNTWSGPVNMGYPVNSMDNEQVVGLNLNNDVLMILNTSTHALQASYRKGRLWSMPRQQCLGDSSERLIVHQAYVAADLHVLLLCAHDTKSPTSDVNIYVSFANGLDQWTAPQILHAPVNGDLDEDFVFINSDDKTLYFRRKKPLNKTENSLYTCTRLDETWLNWSLPKQMNVDHRASAISVSADTKDVVMAYENGPIDLTLATLPIATQPAISHVANLSLVNMSNKMIRPQVLSHSIDDSECKTLTPDQSGNLKYLIANNENMLCYASVDGFFSNSVLLARGDKPIFYLDQDHNDANISAESVRLEQLQIRLNTLNKDISTLELRRSDLPELSTWGQDNLTQNKETAAFNPELNALKGKFDEARGKKETTIPTDEKKPTFQDVVPRQAEHEQESLSGADAPIIQAKKGIKERFMMEKTNVKDSIKQVAPPRFSEDPMEARQAIDDVAQQHEDHNLTLETLDFEGFENRVRAQLFSEQKGNIIKELYVRIVDETMNDGYNRLTDNDEKRIIRPLLSVGKKEVEKNIAQRLSLVLAQNGTEKLLTNSKNANKMEQQLRKILLDDVKEHIKSEWTNILRKEIKWHSDLYFKNTLRTNLQSELLKKKSGRNPSTENTLVIDNKKELGQDFRDTLIKIQQREAISPQIITIYPVQNDQIIPLNGIFFEANESNILPESNVELSRVIDMMRQFPNIMVEIQVHTNGNCSQPFALQLTQRRANAIMTYLSKRGGLTEERFQANGYGKAFPISASNSLEGRLRNQRVEIKIKKI